MLSIPFKNNEVTTHHLNLSVQLQPGSGWGKIRLQVLLNALNYQLTPRHGTCQKKMLHVEVGRFRVSSLVNHNVYTLYIVRCIHILFQMHFVTFSDPITIACIKSVVTHEVMEKKRNASSSSASSSSSSS